MHLLTSRGTSLLWGGTYGSVESWLGNSDSDIAGVAEHTAK